MDLGQTPEVPTADASGAGGAAGAGGEAGTGSAGAGGEAGTGFAGAGGAGGSAAGSTGAGGSDAGAPDAVDAPVDGTVAITCPTVSTDPNAATCRTRGAACTAAGQCASGFCVDGFCCGAACDGACWSCSVGTPGICLEVKGGTDDHCDGTCNAGGGCQKRNGLTCLAGNQCASGVCHDGVCCDTDCSATCRSCVLPGKVGTCSAIVNFDDLQCPVGSSCNGQGVCARKDGGVCAVGSQCLSGFCVDNTCCGSACADACMACNLTGTVGTCAPVPTATPDAPMCTGTNTCDGAGACKKVDGQSCVNASECAGKTCVRNACCSDAYCWPLYAFTSTWGTGDYDRIYALAAAKDGGFVMAGGYQTSARSDEIALVRFNAAGTFQWSKLLGGTDYDTALGAAVLSDDSVMVGGMFASRSLDLDPGATTDVVNLATSIKSACFLSKYDAAGNYVWSRTWIASYNCQVYGVTASPVDDSVYVVAYVQGDVDLDPTAGADPRTPAAVGTAFLVKLTKDGAYLWGRLVPMELYNRVAVGPDGSVFYADGFSSTWDLDPTAGVDMRTPEGGRDAFVMKLGADGSYKWSRVFAGTGAASAEDVAVAPDGSVVVFGEFTGTATFDPAGTVTKTSTDSTDVFVTKLDASGTHQWTQAMGGPSFNEAEGVAVTAAGDIVVVGIYEDPFDLNPGPGVLIPSKRFPANNDVWVDGFSPTGAFQWGRVLPGTSTFNKASVTVLKDGGLAIGAEYHGDPDFDPGPGADGHPTTSYNDVYVTKLTP